MPLSQKEIDEAARQFLTQGPYAYLKQQVTADYQDPTDPYNDYNAAPSEQTFQKMAQAGDDLKNAIAGGGMGGVTNALDSAGFYLNSLGNYARGIGKAYNAAIGSELGMNAVGNVADNAGTWFYDTAGNAEKTSAEYQAKVSDPNNLVYQTLSGSASSIPMMLSSAALSLPLGGMPAMATLMGSSEAAGTAGGLYRRLRAQGMSDQEAKDAANRLFWSEAPLDIASENIFGMFGKLAPKLAPKGAENVAKMIPNGLLRSVLGEGLQEGAQETYQEWLQNAAEKSAGQPLSGYGSALLEEGKNLPEYMRTQGLPGALSGMLMAGIGGAVSSIRQNRAQTPQEKQTIANVQKVQEAFANAAQAGHVYTAPGATENVGTATAAAPMPSTTGTGFEGVDISKGFSPTTTTTATLPGQLVPQGLSDIANPSQGTISTAGFPLPGVIPTTAPTTPSGKPQQTVTRGNAAQVGQAIATAPQPAAQPTAQTPGDVTRVPVSVRGGTDENGNFVLGSDVGDAIRTLIGINSQQPTQSPQSPAQQPTAPANIARVVTPDGNTEIETHYAVVPAESLVTSNTPDFGVNQAYPAELQPRDRTRTANQTNVMNITRNLDPARLADSRLTSEGAPIVDAYGVVESGNGRTLALMRGYRDGAQTMQGYRQYLLDNAARLGLDPAQVASVQNPVLVRVRDTQMTPEQRVAFANASNRSSIAGMSATEQARMDAGNLTNDILSQYNIEQLPSSTGQRNFHQAFLATIPENERGQLIDSKGQPTQALIRREQNALVYAATGDEQLAERMTESTDDNVRIVSNAIVQAAPTLARLNSEMRAGNLRGEYGIASDIATAANKLSQLRNEGQKVEDFLGQRHLFSDLELSEEALTLLEAFDKNKRYANRIRDALLNYAHSVEMLGGPNEQNLFGEATPGKIDLLKAAIDRATNGEGTQGTLFNRPEGNRDYAFIGQKGAEAIDNARKVEYGDQKSLLHKLYDAQQMERNGEDKQKIWLATGWDRGIDGHWRYELLDGKLKNDQLIYANREYHLKDLYDMPALYEAYPQIADLVVRFKPLGRTYGQVVTWNSGKKEIWMNSTIMADLKGTRKVKSEALETFVHEIQHVIQDTEGFASGGDEQAARRAYSKWLSEYAEKLNRWERNVWHDETEKIWKYTHLIKQLGRAERVIFNYQTGRITDTSLRGMWEKELADVRKQLDEVHSTLDEYEKRDAKELEEEGSALYGLNGSSAWQKYAALLGESEARYIEQRLAYTEAQRQAQRPSDYSNVKNAGRILDGVKPTPAPLEAPQTVQTPTPAPAPAPNPAPKPAPTTGGFFGGQGTFGFGDGGGTQGTLFNRKESTVQTAKQIAAEVQDVRTQLVEDLKAAGRDEQSAKAEAQLVAAYFGRTANEARKAGMALSVRDQYERFKVEQGIAPQKGENVYEQDVGANKKAPNDRLSNLTPTQWRQVRTAEFKNWFGDWESAALLKQARNAWTDNNSKGKYAFAPSERLSTELRRLLGHDVESIVITDSTIRHLKNHHGNLKETERGQLSLTPEDIATIPYIVNNYDEVLRSPEYDDKMGNRALEIRKRINGVSVIATIEKGERKNFVVTSWHKKKTGALDAQSAPGLYVRNDPAVLTSIKQDMTKIKSSLDNSSKVVDENGEPLVVYHGTGTPDITEFKHSKATDKTGRMMGLGQGKGKFYFTSTRTGAESAASAAVARGQGKTATVMPVYLRLTNPISLAEYESRYEKLSGHPIFESYSGNYTSDVRDKYIAQLDRAIKKEGYDGIVGEDRGLYVAFSPNQIKSVNNRGTFDSSGNIYNQIAWHGSPFEFDKFTLDHMGEGEGSQAHGWGLYFAKDRTTATDYRSMADTGFTYRGRDINELYRKLERSEEYDKLAVLESFMTELDTETMPWEDFDEDAAKWFKKEILPNVKSGGKLYSANIPENDVLLDEQKSLKEQPLEVKRAVASLAKDNNVQITGGMTGREMYNQLAEALGSPKAASLALNDAGVKGITYESDRDGRCFVVFDDKAISTLERYYQIIGESGANRLSNAKQVRADLGVAREMEEAGKDAKAIRLATGWERGADGKWRYEIMDGSLNAEKLSHKRPYTESERRSLELYGEMGNLLEALERNDKTALASLQSSLGMEKYNDYLKQAERLIDFYDGIREAQKATWQRYKFVEEKRDLVENTHLSDVYASDALYDAYPNLKDYTVRLSRRDEMGNDTRGWFNEREKQIVLNRYLKPEQMQSTLIHEIQHAIQEIEGFAKGSNPEYYERRRKEYKASRESLDRGLKMYLQKIGYPEFLEDSINALKLGKKTVDQHFKDIQRFKEESQYADEIKAFESQIEELDREYNSHGELFGTPYDAYFRSGGEVESRNVQDREKLTAEERRQKTLSETESVKRSNQILLDDVDAASMSYLQDQAPQDYSELRGQISFMDTGEATRDATITLFNADRSTFVHEVGHKMLDDLVHLGQNPDAGAVFKQDLQVAMDWLGVKNASEIGTEQHEKFARAFERYLMEGEAPTSKLAEVFEHFKQWLIDIYRNVANLDVELSPEVRDLFDRLLGKETATETRQSATITGPALTERGAVFQTQTGKDYSFGIGNSRGGKNGTSSANAETLTSLRDIQDAVAELAPVRLGLATRDNRVLGYFKRDAGVIRTRYNHDAEVLLHEAGHKLDQALKIRQSVAASQQAKLNDELEGLGKASSPANADAAYLRKEGIAEFFRLYAYDRQQAEAVAPTYAKMFNEILEKNPEYASMVRKILDTVQAYEAQSDHQKVVSGIVRGEVKQRGKTWRESLRNSFEEFRRHWDDRGRPLQKMEQDVLKWAIKNDRQEMLVKDKNGTYHLKDEYAPYQLWRTEPGYQGAAQERVEAIVEPLRKLGEEKYEQLLDYIVSKRALDYYAAGMEPGIGLRSEDHTRAHIAEIEAAHPDVVKLANQLRDIYEKNTHDMMVGGGIWSQEEYDRIKKENPNYAPLMRVDDDGGMKWAVTGGGQNPVNASKGLKKKKGVGSDRAQMDVIDPINSMIHNILAFQKLSARNQVAQALVNAGTPIGLVEQVEGGEKDGGNTFHVWKDGKQNYYAADKNLIDTLQMLTQVVPQNQAMRIMSKASNILKMFATQLNPAFWAVNLTRDAMQVGITSQSNMAPLYQTYKGLKILLGKDAESMRIKKLAAESGLFHSGVTEQDLHDAKAIDTYLRHAIGDENLWQKFKSFYKGTVGQWNENVEVAPKLAEFAYALKQGVPLREAAVRGREVNLDFDRGGVSAKQINPVIAFFNPAVQGASKTIRTLPRFKTNPAQMLMKVGLYMMLPSIITWALGHDDDEYKRISREFKDRYWIFKVGGTWVRIPKPEGFGLFGSITERLLDYESKNDPDASRQLGTTLWNNFMPNYFPTLFQPIIEHITGTSLFTGHDIIPRRLQDLPPEMQYTRNTSGLAKLLGRTWKLSPIIIDNYIKGYTAGAGQMATGLPDYILDKLGLSGEAPREERQWTEAPIISRFTVDPDRNSETIKRFYDYKRQTLVAKKGYQAHRKAGEAATADMDVRAADMFEKAGKKMSEMNKLYSQVQESRKYTPARKREILDGLRRRMNEIAQNALDRYYKLRG